MAPDNSNDSAANSFSFRTSSIVAAQDALDDCNFPFRLAFIGLKSLVEATIGPS